MMFHEAAVLVLVFPKVLLKVWTEVPDVHVCYTIRRRILSNNISELSSQIRRKILFGEFVGEKVFIEVLLVIGVRRITSGVKRC